MTEEVQFLDSRARIHAASADTRGFTLLEIDAPTGSQPPLHVHREEGEGWFVLDGEITLWVGDETHTLRPGQFLFAPPRVPHTLRMGERGAHYLVIAREGFEAFVRAVGALDGAPDPGEMTRLAAKHGIDLLGPPGMLPTQLAA
jgi:mannose-6-phosphate isomerase-like protein (cupin superfamily)